MNAVFAAGHGSRAHFLKILTNFRCQTSYDKEKHCTSLVHRRFPKKQSSSSRHRQRDGSLTPRESEVLDWLARGKSNAQIGQILGISAATVGKHLEHIYPKLGVENRTAAASFAGSNRL